jgi:hypothetical protein
MERVQPMTPGRVQPSKILRWLKHYWLAVFVAVGCFTSGLLWVRPQTPASPYLVWPAPLFIAVLSMGVLSFPTASFYDALDFAAPNQRFTVYWIPEPSDVVRSITVLFVVSIVLALIVWRLLRMGRFRRAIRPLLYGNFFLGIGFAFLIVIQGSLRTPDFYYTLKSTCTIPVSETTRIRAEYSDSIRPEHRGLAGIPPFRGTSYLVTQNGGETWSLFMHLSPWRGDCRHSGIRSEEFFWLWEGGVLFVSHDAGQHWQIWDVNQIRHLFPTFFGSEIADPTIESVVFTDETHGTMELAYFDHATQTRPRFTLVSTDGGLTWR